MALFLSSGYPSLSKQHAAKQWPVVQGTVVVSKVREKEQIGDDEAASYNAEVAVVFDVQGNRYKIDEIYFSQSNAWTSNLGQVNRTVRQYKRGKRVPVYYDPFEPNYATLEPGIKGPIYATVGLGLAFVLGGLVALFFALRSTVRMVQQAVAK